MTLMPGVSYCADKVRLSPSRFVSNNLKKVNTPARESRGTGENEPLVRRNGAGLPARVSQ